MAAWSLSDKDWDALDRLRFSTSDAAVFRNAMIILMSAVGRSKASIACDLEFSIGSSGDTISISEIGVPGHHSCLPTLPAGTVTSAAGRRPERHPEHRMSLEGRCRAVWVVIFETGRALGFARFEGGRAINDGAIHPELLIPNVGLEPTPCYPTGF